MTLLPVRPIATINAVDESRLLDEVCRVLEGGGDRERKAASIASAIRQAGDYRWVGLYEVTEEEIANLAFDGPGAPAHPRFPATQGLSGSAVASGETVVVGDVREDPRYLTAFGSTRSEIIVPVVDRAGRKVVGTIDVYACVVTEKSNYRANREAGAGHSIGEAVNLGKPRPAKGCGRRRAKHKMSKNVHSARHR